MSNTKKEQPKKESDKTALSAKSGKESTKPHPAAKTAEGIFAQIQKKTGLDDKKIDDWQKKWISLPEKRTKYQHLQDAPNVVGEEVYAMVNDIIDFIQKEEGGKSLVFKKIKENADSFIHNPGDYLKHRAEEGKKFALEAKTYVEKKATQVKERIGKTQNKANDVKKSVETKTAQVKVISDKTTKTTLKTKSNAEENKKTAKPKK